MNSKFHILAALFFLLLIFAVPASASGEVEIDVSGRAVYANGVPIIISGDASQTHLNYDSYSGSDNIAGYTIYGGSKDNSYGASGSLVMTTSVTVQSGTVADVYGGNRGDSSEESSLNTNVVISGGTVGNIYGGNKNGTLNNSILSVSYAGGVVSTVYGGSENGDIANSQLDLSVKDAMNTTDSKISTLYGGSNNGHILTTGLTKSEINVFVNNSVISTLYGGSRIGNIDGDISVSVFNSNISTFHGGSLGGFLDGASGSGIVGHSHYGNIYGNIRSHFYNSSGSVAFGASAYGEVFGNVTFHLNACPICDEGEIEAGSHVCLNSVPGAKHSFNTVVGGGGDSIWATRYSEINYGNVYGDVTLVVAGDTNISYRLMAGGRQGNTRIIPDQFGNPTNDGGNVTMILKGNTSFYWSCAAGYYSYKGLVTEGDVNIIVGGNVTCTQLNGGGEFGGVGGEITITVKENAKLPTIYGGTSDHWWWTPGDGPDETTDKKVTVIVEGGNTDYILSNSRGYLKEFNVIMNSGTVGSIYGGGGFSYAHTDTANIYLNGGNVSYVYAGGYDSTTYLKKKTTIFVNESIGRTPGFTVPSIYGGGGAGSYTESSEIIVDGSKLNYVYGGGFGRTESSVLNIADNSEILILMGGGTGGSTVNNTKINMNGGIVETLYGGGYNTTVNNSSIMISDGQIDHFYLGGTHNLSNSSDSSRVINSVLHLSGGDVCQKIYGSGETKTDTVENVIIHLYDIKAKDYWYYLDSDSLTNADARIIRHGPLVKYDVIEVEDSSKPGYLFPYTLSLNETKEEPKTPTSNSGGKRIVPNSSSGNIDNSSGFETKVEDIGAIVIVLVFPLAIAAFCFARREDRD